MIMFLVLGVNWARMCNLLSFPLGLSRPIAFMLHIIYFPVLQLLVNRPFGLLHKDFAIIYNHALFELWSQIIVDLVIGIICRFPVLMLVDVLILVLLHHFAVFFILLFHRLIVLSINFLWPISGIILLLSIIVLVVGAVFGRLLFIERILINSSGFVELKQIHVVGLDEIQIYKHIRRIKNSFINSPRVEKLFLIPESLFNLFFWHFILLAVQHIIVDIIEDFYHRVLQKFFFLFGNH